MDVLSCPGVLTFFDESPRSEQGVVQLQAGEALVLLKALVQPPDGGGDGGVAEPERGGGKHVGHRRVQQRIVASVRPDMILERRRANDLWNIISHGYNLGEGWVGGGKRYVRSS